MEQLDYDYLAKLVKKTKEGDSNAFAELYTATYKNQYRFAYQYVKDSFLAQDILQDLYIVVLKNIQSLKNPRFFVSWLHQICFRLCFDAAKKAKKEAEELVYEDLSQADALPPPTHTRNRSYPEPGTQASSGRPENHHYGDGPFPASSICPSHYYALLQQHGH